MALPSRTGTPPALSSKFNVGDYITRDDWVYLSIVAVLENSGSPVYATADIKTPNISWWTERELLQKKVYKAVPDFDSWANAKPGDMVHSGKKNAGEYTRILARVNDAVLLSKSPMPQELRTSMNKIAVQLEEVSQGAISEREAKTQLTDVFTHLGAPKTAIEAYTSSDTWYTIYQMAMLHWDLVPGDEE